MTISTICYAIDEDHFSDVKREICYSSPDLWRSRMKEAAGGASWCACITCMPCFSFAATVVCMRGGARGRYILYVR